MTAATTNSLLDTGPSTPTTGNPIADLLTAIFRRFQTTFFNESPTATPEQYPGQSPNGVVTGTVGAADSDGDPVTVTLVGDAAKGTVVVRPDGSYTYTPSQALAVTGGTDTFTVTVSETNAAEHLHGFATILSRLVGAITGGAITPNDGSTIEKTVTVTLAPGALGAFGLEDLVDSGVVEVVQNVDGTVGVIDGKFTDQIVSDNVAAAQVFNSISGLLGGPSGFADATRITRQQVDQEGDEGTITEVFYRLSQVIDGIPVVGGEAVLVTDGNGSVMGVFSSYSGQISTVDTTPDANMSEKSKAEAVATGALLIDLTGFLDQDAVDAFAATLTSQSDLIIYRPDADNVPRLVWRVTVSTPLAPEPDPESDETVTDSTPAFRAQYYIYANGPETGEILSQDSGLDALTSTTYTARDLKGNLRTLNVQKSGNTYILNDSVRNIKTFTSVVRSAGHVLYLDPSPGNYVKNNSFLGVDLGIDARAVSAQANIADIFDYYKQKLGTTSFDFSDQSGLGGGVRLSLVQAGYGNASWDEDGRKGFWFAPGFEKALDIAAHEFTHAVIGDIVGRGSNHGLDGNKESQALNEAYADILGNLIENKTDGGKWTIGEDYPGCSSRPGCGRSMANPERAKYSDIQAADDIHVAESVFDFAAYKMMHDYPATSGVSTVTWSRVFYNSIQRLSFGAKFADAANAVISSARAQGFNAGQVAAVEDAFRKTEILAARTYIPIATGGSTSTAGSSVIATIPANTGVFLMRADGRYGYIANLDDGNVSVLDTATNRVVNHIAVGNFPLNGVIRPDGKQIYIVNGDDSTVSVIDTTRNAVVSTISLNQPASIGMRPDGRRVYVVSYDTDRVAVIDTTSNRVISTISVGDMPFNVQFSADSSRVYVANTGNNTISVINAATNRVAAVIPVGNADTAGLLSSPDSRRLYISNYESNTISVIDTSTNRSVGTIAVGAGPSGMAVSRDGNRLYVSNYGSDTISVIDPSSRRVLSTIRVGDGPGSMSLSADGGRLYVSNYDSGVISVINTASNTVSGTIPVGGGPGYLTFRPDGKRIYVINYNDLTISVIATG
ncbi:MAG: hypothetical protein JWR34_2159 [Mycobacterium sp.]|nr:hypothetical protein [Mycobacterium sp.]